MEAQDSQLLNWITSKCHKGWVIDIEEGWGVISKYGFEPLRDMLRSNSFGGISAGRFCSLYTVSFKITSQPQYPDYSHLVYTRVKYTVEQLLQEDIIPQLVKANGNFLIKEFCQAWNSHKLLTTWMYKLFMHLDRDIVKNDRLPTITSCCLVSFYNIVFLSVKEQIRNVMIALSRQSRDGIIDLCDNLEECSKIFLFMGTISSVNDLANLSKCLNLPPQMHVYEREFERYFLEDLNSYYEEVSNKLISTCPNIFMYLQNAEQLLVLESDRCRKYFHHQTLQKVRHITLIALIVNHAEVIFRELVPAINDLAHSILMNGLDLDSLQFSTCAQFFSPLKSAYQLFRAINVTLSSQQFLNSLSSEFSRFGVLLGRTWQSRLRISDSSSHPDKGALKSYVQGVFAILNLLNQMTSNLFDEDSLFVHSGKRTSRSIVNTDLDSLNVIDIYAYFLEGILQGETDDFVYLEKFMNVIFPILENKDIFLDIYQRFLSKRLLSGKRVSLDTEKLLIALMKLHSGVSYTVKLEGMLNDYYFSEELLTSWRHTRYARELQVLYLAHSIVVIFFEVDLEIKILTNSFWPIFPQSPIHLPHSLKNCELLFTKWYLETNSSRVLKWNYTLGEVLMHAIYPTRGEANCRTYDISLSLEQATVLLYLSLNPVNINDIHESTGIEKKRLRRVLHSLSCQQHKIINKLPPSPKISDTDMFLVNASFNSKLRKFKILMPLPDEPKSSEKHFEIERGAIIDAVIVRILKSRRIISHANLISDIYQQIAHFQPESKLVKSRIGLLIEKGYLERDENDSNLYRYLP